MMPTYIALIKEDTGWWYGWIAEIPGVNCQERTREALLETLRITLAEVIETNRQEAPQAAGEGYEEVEIGA
jgi:predicted RNase H-like HicB family nuclease